MLSTAQIVANRQERYRRMLQLLRNYERTNEQIREMEEMRRETVFEIALRYKKSDANKTYSFPRTENDQNDELTQEQKVFESRRDLLYNLNLQEPVEQQQKQKRATIERMETELVEPRQPNKSRPVFNRIDQRRHRLLPRQQPKYQRQLTERTNNDKSPEMTTLKIPLLASTRERVLKIIDSLAGSPREFKKNSIQLAPIRNRAITNNNSPSERHHRLATQLQMANSQQRQQHVDKAKKKHLRLETRIGVEGSKLAVINSGIHSVKVLPKSILNMKSL